MDCPNGWKTFSGKCYKLSGETKTQSDANTICKAAGGNLATVGSRGEGDFLKNIL